MSRWTYGSSTQKNTPNDRHVNVLHAFVSTLEWPS